MASRRNDMQSFIPRELDDIDEMEEEVEEDDGDAYEPPKRRNSKKRPHQAVQSTPKASSTSRTHVLSEDVHAEEHEQAESRQPKRAQMKHWSQREGPLNQGFTRQRAMADAQASQRVARDPNEVKYPVKTRTQQTRGELPREKAAEEDHGRPAPPQWMNDVQTPASMQQLTSMSRPVAISQLPDRHAPSLNGNFQMPTRPSPAFSLSLQPTRAQNIAQNHRQTVMPGGASSQSVAVGPIPVRGSIRPEMSDYGHDRRYINEVPDVQRGRHPIGMKYDENLSHHSRANQQYRHQVQHREQYASRSSPSPERSPSPPERHCEAAPKKSVRGPSETLISALAKKHMSPKDHRYAPYPKPFSPSRHSSSKRERRHRHDDSDETEKPKLSVQAKYAASARRGGRLPTDIDAFGYQESENRSRRLPAEEAEPWSTVQMIEQLKSGSRVRGRDITVSAHSPEIPTAYKNFQPRFKPKIAKEIKTSVKFTLPQPKEVEREKHQPAKAILDNQSSSPTSHITELPRTKLTLFKPKPMAEDKGDEQEIAARKQRIAALTSLQKVNVTNQTILRDEAEEANAEPAKFSLYRTSRFDTGLEAAESSGTEHDTSFDSSNSYAHRSDSPPTSPLAPMQSETPYFPNRLESRRARDLSEEALQVSQNAMEKSHKAMELSFESMEKSYEQMERSYEDIRESFQQQAHRTKADYEDTPPVSQKRGGWRLPFFGGR